MNIHLDILELVHWTPKKFKHSLVKSIWEVTEALSP
jgi:hypothetical protein